MSPKYYSSSIPTWGCTMPALPGVPAPLASSDGSCKDRLQAHRTRTQPPSRKTAGSHTSKKEASTPSQGLAQHLKYFLPIGIARRQPANSHPCLAPAHYNMQNTTVQARKAPHHQATYEVYRCRSARKEGLFPSQHTPAPQHTPSLHLSPWFRLRQGRGGSLWACSTPRWWLPCPQPAEGGISKPHI